MDHYVAKDFGKLLKRNALGMRRLMLRQQTDVMRVYDRNLVDLPISVDLYGPYARITDYGDDDLSEDDLATVCDIASRMLYVEPDKVVYHYRKKRTGKEQHDVQDDSSLLVTVKENGLLFSVDLTKRIDTGLFLDQAVSRVAIRDISAGLDVLNLFSYTGSFSVYAAAGGAKSVTSVDLSATYTQWCEQNLAANGFSGGAYPCVSQDAGEYIRNAVKERRKFDIVIFDPPSFSNSRKMEHDFDVQRDYAHFMQLLNGLLVDGGTLLFSTNLGKFRFEKRRIHGYDVREITRDIAAPGFSAKKSTLRSWILEKTKEVKVPLEEEARVARTTEEVVEAKVEALEPLVDLQEEDDSVAAFDDEAAEDMSDETYAFASDEDDEDEDSDYDADDEDDELVLGWEPEEASQPVNDGKNAKQRRYERRHPGETAAPPTIAEPKAERPARAYSGRDTQRGTDRERSSGGYGDDRRPARRFDSDRPREDRPYDRDRAPRRFDNDRPRGDRPFDRDRPPRRFESDRPREDRP
jgi:23S rRNA G2069 N7-methylase RlmK/C1962 C5-methylase RlmI